MSSTTDKMNLVIPDVSVELGPTWATLLNAALELIDEHDHSTGKGNKIGTSGINIADTFELNNNKLTEAQVVALQNLGAAQTSDTGSLQRVGTNLYWINSAGTAVQITSGTGLNVTGTGAFTVDAPGAYPYTILLADSQTVQIIDTSGGARTINLPAATNNIHVILKDGNSNASANNITVTPNGSDVIDGNNSNYVIDWDDAAVGFISDGVSKWWVV